MRAVTPRSACSSDSQWVGAALGWLARFPLLGEVELAVLLGVEGWIAEAVLREGRKRGWVASVLVHSPEFQASERLCYLTEAGVAAVADMLSTDVTSLSRRLPVSRSEVLARLARVEVAVSVARFVARLADDLRQHGDGVTLDEACSTPWASGPHRAGDAPPAVEGWVRLRQGAHRATFLLAWDRAGAPYTHRRGRVATWYRADDLPERPWGPSLPPVLVVCAGGRHVVEWTTAAERSADRRHRNALRLGVAVSGDLDTRGPLHTAWWRPGGGRPVVLLDLLAWRSDAPATVHPAASVPRPAAQQAQDTARPGAGTEVGLHDWATAAVRDGRGSGRCTELERWAALAVSLSPSQKTLLIWVAHHPLLPPAHLAAHLELNDRAVARLMAGLVGCGLVMEEATPGAAPHGAPCYVLTLRGAGYLAARDGVPLGVYLRDGVIAVHGAEPGTQERRRGRWPPGPVRVSDALRHPEHTAGVHRFALALAGEAAWWRARAADHQLLAWLNAAEGQAWFRRAGCRGAIRPDARFRYRAGGVVYDLILEWDRGLVRRRDYARKFSAYAAYFAMAGPAHAGACRLVVVTPASAVERVRAAVSDAAWSCPVLAEVTRIVTAEAVGGGRMLPALLWPGYVASGERSYEAGIAITGNRVPIAALPIPGGDAQEATAAPDQAISWA